MVNEYQTPWQILEISEDADLAAIRRAYAVKLKTVRPDEDPVAFQRLREARDSAVRQHKYRAGAAGNSGIRPVGIEILPYSPEAVLDPWSIEFDDPVPVIVDDWPPEASSAAKKTPLIEEPQPAEEEAEIFSERSAGGELPPAPEIARQVMRQLQQEDLEVRWDFDTWWTLLSQLGRLGFNERREIEFSIITALPAALASNHKRIFTPQARQMRAKVFSLFNDEFGWLQQDRGLYRALEAKDADRLVSLLHRSLDDLQNASRVKQAGQDDIPLVYTHDLEAFFNPAEERKTIDYYQRSFASGRWKASWHWGAFFFVELWAAYRGLWRHMFVLFAINSAALAVLLGGAASDSPMMEIIGAAIRLTTHTWSGFYARRWLIRRAARAVEAADALDIHNTGRRREYLRKAAEKSGGKFIFVIFVFMTLLRFLLQSTVEKSTSRVNPAMPNFPKQLNLRLPDEVRKEFPASKCAPGDIQCTLKVLNELQRKLHEQKEKLRLLHKQPPK